MVLMESHCPDAARSALTSSAIRFARHVAPNRIETLRGFPSDGDDIGDAAAGGSILPSFFPAGRDEIEIVGSSQIDGE